MADDPQADTAPLDEEFLPVVELHNRDFQQYSVDRGIYLAPIDDDEADRLNHQHRVLTRINEGLILVDVRNPKSILDCGYGTAAWAIDVANEYPDCIITGVDISPHLIPDDTPENFFPQCDNLNDRFTFEDNHFDLVHSRLLGGGINSNRWRSYLRDIFRVLKPGGWLQMSEIYYNSQSDNGTLTEDHALRRWSARFFEAMEAAGKDPRVGNLLPRLLPEAGFERVQVQMVPLRLCGWAKNDSPLELEQQGIGQDNLANVSNLLDSLSVYPLLEQQAMAPQERTDLLDQARTEAATVGLRPYFALYNARARKPGGN
ncbi:MAG: hypothetical protein M1817_006268 [Caeruleum heppii]|nr:MAG: hypothetical protein M1817_006268 [Caeruleum heppii]